jgi:mono/diheme cytochrome c family protein
MNRFKKILKWTGITAASFIILILAAYLIIYFITEQRINQKYSYAIPDINIPRDSVSIARGEHLYHIRGCVDCHGENLAGKIYMNNSMLLKLTIPNLTKGEGGLPTDFNVRDWMRVLRHGVGRDGKSLWVMPSHESSQLSKGDIADLIAYCTTRLPVNTSNSSLHKIGPIGRIVIALDQAVVLPAEKIDHHSPMSVENHAGVSAAYGKYLSVSCQGCHRSDLHGGGPLAPGYPEVPDITADGHPGNWRADQFIRTIRTGETPEGKKLRSNYMPWKGMDHFSDDELNAIFQYLQSLTRSQEEAG